MCMYAYYVSVSVSNLSVNGFAVGVTGSLSTVSTLVTELDDLYHTRSAVAALRYVAHKTAAP